MDQSSKAKLEVIKLEPNGIGQPVIITSSLANGFDRLDSLTTHLEDSLKHLLDVAVDFRNAAEKVFTHMDETLEENVFLNVLNLCQFLVFMAAVGHSLPSKEIKELLLKMKKRDRDLLDNSETARLVCARASRDLMAWEHRIKHQCLFNEYLTRRRLYVNRMACRSYSVGTGSAELNRWAMGDKMVPLPPTKNIFRTWDFDEEKEKIDEKEKLKKEVKLQPPMFKPKLKQKELSTKEPRLPSGQKCPILLTATQFEIPIHPFILDMKATYTLRAYPHAIRAIRFVNDSSGMLRHFKIGQDHCGARIPCRLKDGSNSMEMMVFWSGLSNKKFYNILALVEAVICGYEAPTQQKYNGPVQETVIHELHLPLWETSSEAANIAFPISKRISDHLFTEGGFGDLADIHDVRPNADPSSTDPPSLQTFDSISIRTPEIEGQKAEDLDLICPVEKGGIKVSLPYYLVLYDDVVKCPIYLSRVSKPATVKDTIEYEESKWSRVTCCIG